MNIAITGTVTAWACGLGADGDEQAGIAAINKRQVFRENCCCEALVSHVRPPTFAHAYMWSARAERDAAGQEESLTGQNGRARGGILRPSRHREAEAT